MPGTAGAGGLLAIQREVGGGRGVQKTKRKGKKYEVKLEYPRDGGWRDQDGDQTKKNFLGCQWNRYLLNNILCFLKVCNT